MEGLTVATVRGEWLATGPRGSPTPRGRLLEELARAPSTGRFRSFVELAEVGSGEEERHHGVFRVCTRARREFRDVFCLGARFHANVDPWLYLAGPASNSLCC